MQSAKHAVLTQDGLEQLFQVLSKRGYRVLGPTVRDQAIVYDDIAAVADLPRGWSDEQDGGLYRLRRRDDDALFGYAVGPHSWKRYLHPPREALWSAERTEAGITITPEPPSAERLAFIGVRACELHAIAIQDRVLMGGAHVDPRYRARREGAFLVAVNCGTAAGTCFCASMNTGPKVDEGYDLALTELIDGRNHRFLVATGSAEGSQVLAELKHRPATAKDIAAAEAVVAHTASNMGRVMAAEGVAELLLRNPTHPRWDEVAARCLTCGNCTMACPTCFCTTVEESNSLDGARTARAQRWDSCFNIDFSFLHDGSVRTSASSRYRQWMTHKLATWWDQFGSSGCVGCGRCITWCPVGIDITAEVAAIRESETG